MASLDFYAVEKDIADIWEFIFSETDCKVFEAYSEHEKDLREFKSVSAVLEAFYSKPFGTFFFALWSPSVSSNVSVRRIELKPEKCNGATFRFTIEGWGIMYFNLGRISGSEIDSSNFGHNSEKRARNWEVTLFDRLGSVEDWDWKLLNKLSGKIQYHIRKRLAVSKVSSRPVLENALKKYSEGYRFKHITIEDKL